MRAEKCSEAGPFAIHVTTHSVLVAVVAGFLLHERLRVFVDFLADAFVLPEVGLERRVASKELLIVYQRRIVANLFGDFAVIVEEFVETAKFGSRSVAVANIVVPRAGIGIAIAIVKAITIIVTCHVRVSGASSVGVVVTARTSRLAVVKGLFRAQ